MTADPEDDPFATQKELIPATFSGGSLDKVQMSVPQSKHVHHVRETGETYTRHSQAPDGNLVTIFTLKA